MGDKITGEKGMSIIEGYRVVSPQTTPIEVRRIGVGPYTGTILLQC